MKLWQNHVFVVGCGHTGTSLVAAMLGAHPDIYTIPFETDAFLDDRPQDEAVAIIAAAAAANDKAATLICEKTPRHVHHVDRIAAAFDEPRFILCLRHPLDVIHSFRRRYRNIRRAISRWTRAHQAVVPLLARPDCCVLRYEALVSDTDAELTRLCTFLGLPFDPAMNDFWQDSRDWFGVSERRDTDGHAGENHVIRRNWQIHQPLMKNRVGLWHQLAPKEIALACSRIRPLAAELSYRLDDDPGPARRKRR